MLRTFKLVIRSSEPEEAVEPTLWGNLDKVFRQMLMSTHLQTMGISFSVDSLTEVADAKAQPIITHKEPSEAQSILERIAELRKKTAGERNEE